MGDSYGIHKGIHKGFIGDSWEVRGRFVGGSRPVRGSFVGGWVKFVDLWLYKPQNRCI